MRTPATTPRKRGAPMGNRNALKHGKYTRERRALYAAIRAHIEAGRLLVAELTLASARLKLLRSLDGRTTSAPEVRTFAEGQDILCLSAGRRDRVAHSRAGRRVQARARLREHADPARTSACHAVPSRRLGGVAAGDRRSCKNRGVAGRRGAVRSRVRARRELPQQHGRLPLRAHPAMSCPGARSMRRSARR